MVDPPSGRSFSSFFFSFAIAKRSQKTCSVRAPTPLDRTRHVGDARLGRARPNDTDHLGLDLDRQVERRAVRRRVQVRARSFHHGERRVRSRRVVAREVDRELRERGNTETTKKKKNLPVVVSCLLFLLLRVSRWWWEERTS